MNRPDTSDLFTILIKLKYCILSHEEIEMLHQLPKHHLEFEYYMYIYVTTFFSL